MGSTLSRARAVNDWGKSMFRRTMAIAAAAALAAATLLAAPAALGAEPANDITKGNADVECQSAGYDYGVKLDTGEPGTYSAPDDFEMLGHNVSIDVTISAEGVVSFENANPPVSAVLIKAGEHFDIFEFNPPVTSASGLEPSVTNGISHVTFCYDNYIPREQLSVVKTAETSFTRTHNWDLEKTVDPADVKLYAPGGTGSGTATVNWTVAVDYLGYTDSNYNLTGTVTVTNVGGLAATVNGLADAMQLNSAPYPVTVVCPVDFGIGALLAVGASIQCSYTVTDIPKAIALAGGTNQVSITTAAGNTYTSDAVPVVWSAMPASEANATVTVTDVSEIGGTRTETITAAEGDSTITYSNVFAWSDYEECGDYSYDNTATLMSGETTLDTDSETVNVHVQCLIFDGETAWAANGAAGKDRYTSKGNWATYVTYVSGTTATYPIYAGQTTLIGTATITPVTGGVTVTVDLDDAWAYAEGGANLKIQGYNVKPSGNPSPGTFASHTTCTGDPCTSGTIAVSTYYGIHLDVGQWVPDPEF